jgi:hypothetical protein
VFRLYVWHSCRSSCRSCTALESLYCFTLDLSAPYLEHVKGYSTSITFNFWRYIIHMCTGHYPKYLKGSSTPTKFNEWRFLIAICLELILSV